MKNTIRLLCVVLIALAGPVNAEELVRCVAPSGKVTFVKHSCPPANISRETLEVNNPPPSGSSPPSQMADPAILNKKQTVKVTVVDSGPKPRDMGPQSPIQREMEAQRQTRAERMKNPGTREPGRRNEHSSPPD